MFQRLLLLFFVSIPFQSYTQSELVKPYGFELIDIPYLEGDTIRVLKSVDKQHKKKPVLFFLQGSLPRPLLIDYGPGMLSFTNFSNFSISGILQNYHLCSIAPPGVPVYAKAEQLTGQGLSVPDISKPTCFSKEYQMHNNLNYLADRVSRVVEAVCSMPDVDSNSVVLIGHSQGALIGAEVAARNKHVTKFAFLSSNPSGRVFTNLFSIKSQYLSGSLDYDQYVAAYEEILLNWKYEVSHLDSIPLEGDPPGTTVSFSKDFNTVLAGLKIPLYVGYGTNDPAAFSLEWLPVYLIQNGKTNYTIHPYKGLEHNFAEVKPDGRPDYSKMHWQEIIDDILLWLGEQ